MGLAETASVHALDEMCLIDGDDYGSQQYQRLMRLAKELAEMQTQDEAGRQIDPTRYWDVRDQISELEQRISGSAGSPFELSRRVRRRSILSELAGGV